MKINDVNVSDAMIGITTGTPVSEAGFLPIPYYGANANLCGPLTNYTPIMKVLIDNAALIPDRNSTGQYTDVTPIISKLNLCQIPQQLNKSSIDACVAQDAIFIPNAKKEFQYYYVLYTYAIKKLMDALQAPATGPLPPSLNGWSSKDAAVAAYKKAAIQLNQNVNDITFVIDAVAQNRRTSNIPSLTTQLSNLDASLTSQAQKLLDQRQILSDTSQSNMLLQKEMESYSRQKAGYHNNMLMLYSFLNITALGLLFYVYRAM